jgi:hypothetical protein
MEEAHRYATRELQRLVRSSAREAGTSQTTVQTQTRDRISPAADGTEVFIERIVSARLSGAPDLVRSV